MTQSLTHETWRNEIVAAAEGDHPTSVRALLDDRRSPNLLSVRWGAPLDHDQRLEFLATLCFEMRHEALDAGGNDKLTDKEMASLEALLRQVSLLDHDYVGPRGHSVKHVLAAAAEAFPYLDSFFSELTDQAEDDHERDTVFVP